MGMISFETKTKIEELEKKYKDVLSVVNEDEINKELEEVEKKLTDPSVWDDQKKAREYTQKLKRLKNISEDLKRVRSLFEDLEVAIELSDEDQEMAQHVEEIVQELEGAVKKLELEIILNGKYDPNNAYLSVHPGAGGTESQDWAQMLLRMYMRWAERKGFDVEIVEFQPGEEAGIKDATILIKGEYAYGYLKHESGVHRLVRISPFDAARRRHTSFASVNVIPEIDDDVDIEIRPEDLKIETFRASGHGGQNRICRENHASTDRDRGLLSKRKIAAPEQTNRAEDTQSETLPTRDGKEAKGNTRDSGRTQGHFLGKPDKILYFPPVHDG